MMRSEVSRLAEPAPNRRFAFIDRHGGEYACGLRISVRWLACRNGKRNHTRLPMRATAHRSILFALALAEALACIASAPAAAVTIDNFSSPLPPNPCLPNSGAAVVFAGPYCDGASCPPDSWVTCAETRALQTGLPGVLGGRREAVVTEWTGAPLSARVDPASHSLRASFGGTQEAWVELDYGTPFVSTQDPDALNLDLVALAASGFEFTLDGGLSPAQPVLVVIELLADAATSPRPSAHATVIVTSPGPVFVSLAQFVPGAVPGFTMSDVDDIQILLSNCTNYLEGCGDATFTPFDVRLGQVSIASAPIPVTKTSWGRLKASYR